MKALDGKKMGDNNAVEMGQAAHVNIGVQIGAIKPRKLLAAVWIMYRSNSVLFCITLSL